MLRNDWWRHKKSILVIIRFGMVVVSILGLIILLFTYKVIWSPDEILLAPCHGFKKIVSKESTFLITWVVPLSWSHDVVEFAKCHVILTWASWSAKTGDSKSQLNILMTSFYSAIHSTHNPFWFFSMILD